MGKGKKKSINKEEICEDCCFKCKDGGSLRICDYKDCLKAYHPKCEEKDDSFLESEVPWTCSWHSCFSCGKTPKFHCLCCPNAICGRCLCDFKFSVISNREGLCSHCAAIVAVLEGSKVLDLVQEKVNFNDTDTYEFFFKEYWNMIKQKKGLTSVRVVHIIEQLNTGRVPNDIPCMSGSEDSSEFGDEYESQSSNDHWNDAKRHRKSNKRKKNRENSSSTRRTGKFKKKEFNGWASNLLIDFLESIGKNVTEELSQHDVNAIVVKYCCENKLFDPVKKKRVLCDDRLRALLGRRRVLKNSIHNLLNPHFAENVEQSENDQEQSESDHEFDSENKNERILIRCKRQKNSSSKIEPQKNEEVNPQQGCFASMVAQNIKCLYLNKSLVEELLKQPETFDEQVTGSFVRIKSDPYDYLQKNSHMLVKVTGVKKISRNDEVTKDVFLQVSNMPKDITISQLSNDNFSEEECEDLRQRVKDGRLGRTSMVEFEEKAQSLHVVITKQWIAKELHRLPKLIEQANEKGWRRQLHEYMERKQLLEKPSEQTRLLDEFPEIIADKTEVELTEQQSSKKDEEENARLPESNSSGFSKPGSMEDMGGNGIFSCQNGADSVAHEQQYQGPESKELEQQIPSVSSHENNNAEFHQEEIKEPVIIEQDENLPEGSRPNSISIPTEKMNNEHCGKGLELIEISDEEEQMVEISDDDDEQMVEIRDGKEQDDNSSKKTEDNSSSCCLWYCMSEHGIKAGPYSMSLLRQWSQTLPNELGFKVWKANQSSNEAIPLLDAIRQFYNTSREA